MPYIDSFYMIMRRSIENSSTKLRWVTRLKYHTKNMHHHCLLLADSIGKKPTHGYSESSQKGKKLSEINSTKILECKHSFRFKHFSPLTNSVIGFNLDLVINTLVWKTRSGKRKKSRWNGKVMLLESCSAYRGEHKINQLIYFEL